MPTAPRTRGSTKLRRNGAASAGSARSRGAQGPLGRGQRSILRCTAAGARRKNVDRCKDSRRCVVPDHHPGATDIAVAPAESPDLRFGRCHLSALARQFSAAPSRGSPPPASHFRPNVAARSIFVRSSVFRPSAPVVRDCCDAAKKVSVGSSIMAFAVAAMRQEDAGTDGAIGHPGAGNIGDSLIKRRWR